MCRVRLNIWDIGGQATLRPYWQNYYERTDALLWVVDSSDVERLEICRDELHGLLKEEKLVGATLLILANKQDLQGALPATKIKQVQCHAHLLHLSGMSPLWGCSKRRSLLGPLCSSWPTDRACRELCQPQR